MNRTRTNSGAAVTVAISNGERPVSVEPNREVGHDHAVGEEHRAEVAGEADGQGNGLGVRSPGQNARARGQRTSAASLSAVSADLDGREVIATAVRLRVKTLIDGRSW